MSNQRSRHNERSSMRRYLQQLGQSWYVRIKVPKSLQEVVGNTHIRKALHTRDLDTANRMKWAQVESIKAYLHRLKGLDPLNMKAQGFRESIRKARDKGDYEGADALELGATDEAEKIFEETKGDSEKAKEWYALATSSENTLDELIDMWLSSAEYTKQTKKQHRSAYIEFKHHLGGDKLPSMVTDDIAISYVEETLRNSGQAYNTQRRKLNTLSAFWEWMSLRKHVPRNKNPWKGFKLSKLKTPKKTEDKRPYTVEELIHLFSTRPSYDGLPDVMVLGLYTGARLEEICSLRQGDVKLHGKVFMVSINKSKTAAGIRTIAVAHPLPCSIIKSRWKTGKGESEKQLFPEFKPGGYDNKLSWSVSKAFGRHRTASGLTGATDFHSFRRTLVTRMENLSIDQVRMARYIGHDFPTIAFAVYSGGSSEKTNIEVARSIMYPKKVEAAVKRFIEQ